jgi:phosphoribosylformylglycinamidine cyclo-ligase
VPKAKQGLTYAKAGVDTIKQRQAIQALASQVAFQRRGNGRPLTGLNHFAGLVAWGKSALAICTDGVGTKVEVANALRKWDTIGIDAIAMNVNDCICVGAEPLAFVDYIAIERPDAVITGQIGKGLNTGAKEANITLAGGETAIMPETVNGLDLAGTCVGVIDRDKIVSGKAVRRGDVLIGLPSSGLHSNGFTLARKILEHARVGLDEPCPGTGGRRWGPLLLEPTRIYVRPVLKLLASVNVHALANITGGALKNIPRVNHGHRYVIDAPLKVPPVFPALQALGDVEWQEMYQTFNMGLGFVAVVSAKDEAKAMATLKRAGEKPAVIGRVEKGRGAFHEPTGLFFEPKA